MAAFYRKDPEQRLRLGDVLSGYVLAATQQEDVLPKEGSVSYSVGLKIPDFCVVLTPCCSIGKRRQALTVAPLVPLDRTILAVPYLAEDPTRLNRKDRADKLIRPEQWNSLSPQEQQERLSQPSYANLEDFVYAGSDLFPDYDVKVAPSQTLTTNCRVVDFRDTYTLTCKQIQNATNYPLESKKLQLAAMARHELRIKLGHFFMRPAQADLDEDAAVAVLMREFGFL